MTTRRIVNPAATTEKPAYKVGGVHVIQKPYNLNFRTSRKLTPLHRFLTNNYWGRNKKNKLYLRELSVQ